MNKALLESKQPKIFQRKIILTGGSSGIGKSIVYYFSSKGCKVAFTDINEPDEILENTFFTKADVSDTGGIEKFFTEATHFLDIPDVIICNAGQGIHEKLSEGDPEKWNRILDTNLMGTLRIIRAFVPAMAKKSGDIIFISSVSANKPYEGGAIYAASKAAINTIAETLRLEVQPNIRVATIAPGVVDTHFFENIIGGTQSVESIGWGALSPDEIAETIEFIISRPKNMAINFIEIRPAGQPM